MRPKLFGSVPDHRVLVTGCPRSGTTFVGTVLAFPRSVDYFHEPLNPDCGLPGVVRRYIDLDDPVHADAASRLEELLSYRPLLRGATYAPDRLSQRAAKRVVGGRGPAHLSVARLNPWSRHVVIKDPFAVRSVGWFIAQGVDVVAVIRHPAAVAVSYRRRGWRALHSLDARPPDSGRREGAMGTEDPTTDLEAAAAHWANITRHLVDDPRIRTVLHERLSANPDEEFAELRAQLGLPWSRLAAARLHRLTSGPRRSTGSASGQALRRSSASILADSIASLDDDELDTIWKTAGGIAGRWYQPKGLA